MDNLSLHGRRWRLSWERFTRSLWWLPTLFTTGAIGLFLTTSWLDRQLHDQLTPTGWASWLELAFFASGPSVAESLLTNISGMWATIIGISFSVTLVTIQLTATKYIAQVLPLFERNRINQLVLGSYLATVTYAMLVARTVRVEDPGFVPYIGVNVATLLAVVSIFLLILFITNVVNFVRPQFFLDQTLADTETALAAWERPTGPWRAAGAPADAEARDARAGCFKARRKSTLTNVLLIELGRSLQARLAATPASGGRWIIELTRSPGDVVHRNEPLAYITGPSGASTEPVQAAVALACVLQSHAQALDSPEVGIEALAGLTIKGAVQGDLDVTFEGVDCLFSLIPQLARSPAPADHLTLSAGAHEIVLKRPAPDLLAKAMRELTVISEVALAPSLPFRLVTEGISHRFAGVLGELLANRECDAALRIVRHLNAWYQSAFFHMGWISGMGHLADDLVEMATAAHRSGASEVLEAVVGLLRDNRDRLAPDAQAREALDDAFDRLASVVGAHHPALVGRPRPNEPNPT
ncbi:MAG: DUF2254 family protein [Candidatus Sericytochromatia bacterium]